MKEIIKSIVSNTRLEATRCHDEARLIEERAHEMTKKAAELRAKGDELNDAANHIAVLDR